MLCIHRLDTSDAAALFTDAPSQWREGLLAFAAEEEGEPVALALAESHPRAVHVLAVAGREDACRLLLERLVRLAGERDMSAWCPAGRDDLREALEEWGFRVEGRGEFRGRTAYLYRWRRNEGGPEP